MHVFNVSCFFCLFFFFAKKLTAPTVDKSVLIALFSHVRHETVKFIPSPLLYNTKLWVLFHSFATLIPPCVANMSEKETHLCQVLFSAKDKSIHKTLFDILTSERSKVKGQSLSLSSGCCSALHSGVSQTWTQSSQKHWWKTPPSGWNKQLQFWLRLVYCKRNEKSYRMGAEKWNVFVIFSTFRISMCAF